MQPENFGYQGDDIQRELIAEAIRAYMRDPNYIKSVAPDVATLIREHVNVSPNLNRIVQFNSAGAGVLGAGLLTDDQEPSF